VISLELAFARSERSSDFMEVHAGCASFGEHSVRLLFFLDVVLGDFPQYVHLRRETRVAGARNFELRNQPLGNRKFNFRLVVGVFVARGGEEGGIENLFFEPGVKLQCLAYLLDQVELPVLIQRPVDLLKPRHDPAVIGFEKFDRVPCHGHPLCSAGAKESAPADICRVVALTPDNL
jgi:hypothetical protein